MCSYLCNVIDMEKLDRIEKEKLAKYLEGRRKDLSKQMRNINKALKAIQNDPMALPHTVLNGRKKELSDQIKSANKALKMVRSSRVASVVVPITHGAKIESLLAAAPRDRGLSQGRRAEIQRLARKDSGR
jgi:hypothetical protein